jgi:glycerophosphoryl diester phosphodiesterase
MPLALPSPPWIVGHRGARAEITENTLAGFDAALSQGADMIEMDVQLTADGVPVVFHDWDLRRLAARPEVLEQVASATLDAVRVHDPEATHDAETHRIPRLVEVLDALPPRVPLNLEVKCRLAAPETLLDALEPLLDRRGDLLVSSFSWDLLAALRRRRPGQPVAPLARRHAAVLLAAGERLGAFSLHCRDTLAGRELVRAATAAGRPLLAYTVNEAGRARTLLDRGVAGLFTDRPGALRAQLERSDRGADR